MSSTVATGPNASLLEQQFEEWRRNPDGVDPSWAAFFAGFELGCERAAAAGDAGDDGDAGHAALTARLVALTWQFRMSGHRQAHFNPLSGPPDPLPHLAAEIAAIPREDHALTVRVPGFADGKPVRAGAVIASLQAAYCGPIGFEFMHIDDPAVRAWVAAAAEARPAAPPPPQERRAHALRWLLEAELFEQFLGRKFLGEKRFSLEGGEGTLVALNAILESCPSLGVAEIEMGMSHRGRLNVLANFLRKTLTTILYEFTANYVPDTVAGDGDVKYHLGYENHRELADGRVRVSLAANPSHLEAVNAIVQGKARARQRLIGDDGSGSGTNRKRVLPLLLHGDAAFAGQGSVAEVLNLSQLPGYRTGGTLHLIINNQIGFTTNPADARSSLYATDVAKMIEAPILHVNGEDPMALHWAARTALEFRQQFGRDVVLDILCYRRQGHNESDQAAFTQPLATRHIAARETIGQLYKTELVANGTLEAAEAESIEQTIWDKLEAGYKRMVELSEAGERDRFSGSTATVQPPYSHAPTPTGIAREQLQHIGAVLTRIPEGFQLHPTLARRFLPRRVEAFREGGPFDWALAEALAFGSLLLEGTPVRLSGQDSRRGTFSQRHAVLYDFETRARHIPLEHLDPGQARFCVYNSLLSEFAVLGFDYGYSLGHPAMLTLWEAQFGDFANGAQPVIDQFIASAESKWQTPSDIVLLLPHGYEGMGPEHSSARLERFLQLCAADNLIVANCSTPAQYFHLLRRQKHRPFRKPLVLMTPKSLLTRKEASSREADFLDQTHFHEILDDPDLPTTPEAVERIVLCSGKVYYDLAAHRRQTTTPATALVRIEQLAPLHRDLLARTLARYPQARTLVWCQEEPANMGAWNHLAPALRELTGHEIRYAGRPAAASPATGAKAVHFREQNELLAAAFAP